MYKRRPQKSTEVLRDAERRPHHVRPLCHLPINEEEFSTNKPVVVAYQYAPTPNVFYDSLKQRMTTKRVGAYLMTDGTTAWFGS